MMLSFSFAFQTVHNKSQGEIFISNIHIDVFNERYWIFQVLIGTEEKYLCTIILFGS